VRPRASAAIDWPSALDFDRAIQNVHTDILHDWFRDPWGWPELDWVVNGHLPQFAVPRLNATGVKAAAKLDVPKENFSLRPAIVFDPLDRLIYQALVDRLSVGLIGELPVWAYGWRLSPENPQRGSYEPNDREWERFRDHLARLASYDAGALTTDIVSFFGSIPVGPLTEQILAVDANAPGARLADMVESWYLSTGRGLPQRSAASAALAHFYLSPLDDILGSRNTVPPGGRDLIPEGRALRWMDDVWLFGRTLSSLRESQLAIQAGMRGLGLEMNIGKTRVLSGDAMIDAVFEIEHSAVDSALAEDDPDVQPLDELIDSILQAPETAERTSIRFMTTRMRIHQLFDRVSEIADEAPRMPHAADHLARLFRDSQLWNERQEWYVGQARRWRERLPWSIGQLGTMFPTRASVDESVLEFFKESISTGNTPLPILSVAAQRLAAWAPGDARVIMRDAASRESHPLSCRALALALLHAGETKNVVRQILRQNEENALVLAMLEDTNFRKTATPVSADFAG
jgi:hypothetical protein